MKKIFLLGLAVVMCAIAANAQCVYPTDNVTINFKRKVPGLMEGNFSVSSTKKVQFSGGNLQYNSDNQTWQFAAKQYTTVGNNPGNTAVTVDGLANNNGKTDLFGWVGASSSWTDPLKIHGISASTASNAVDGYGNVDGDHGETLKSDWGTLMGSGWRTLTKDEWNYLIGGRTNYSNLRTVATVHGVRGLILLPDGWTVATSEIASLTMSIYDKTVSDADWTILEKEGAVFLPTGAYRWGTGVSTLDYGSYWSSTPDEDSPGMAYRLYISSGGVHVTDYGNRSSAWFVRLVQDVVPD